MIGGLALVFVFSNGYRDSSTIVATVVSTRTLTPQRAFAWCALFEFLGALFIGTAVAVTMGKGLFEPVMNGNKTQLLLVVSAALTAAILWGAVSWWQVWPTSNSQALFGGLVGASVAEWGPHYFQNFTVAKVLLILILSPILGFLIALIITKVIRKWGAWMTPRVQPIIEKLHVLSCLTVALAHGSNDGQIAMAVILLAYGTLAESVSIPFGVRLAVALALSLGVLFGGRRLLKKLGMQFYRLRLMQGLGSQLSSAATVLACSMSGFPASTTQVITGSIAGAGVAKNASGVRWGIAGGIVMSWLITLPVVALLGFLINWGLNHVVF